MRNEPFRKALVDSVVPTHLQPGLLRWIEEGIRPGGFLSSVLANNLIGAAARADELSLVGLPILAKFLVQHAPNGSYGSPKALKNWPDFIVAQNRRDADFTSWTVGTVLRELTERDVK